MNTLQSQPPTPRITFLEGRGDLPMLEITTRWSTAEISLHGAHVTHFKRHDEPPLLFLSQCSRFERTAPIRGGIPIIFPWFGKPADRPGQHGFARTRTWALKEIHAPADGPVSVRLTLPPSADLGEGQVNVEDLVHVDAALTAELIVRNNSTHPFTFENCLHTYFTVGDIHAVSVAGLQGVHYLDQPTGFTPRTETDAVIRFTGEVDRAYLNTRHAVEIRDPALGRSIRVEKTGSDSTVVWNPWSAKAKAMPDFGDDEYLRTVCVESGNVADNRVTLAPGERAALQIKLSSAPLK